MSSALKKAAGTVLDLIYPQNLYCLCCEDTMEQSRVHGICDRCAEKMDWLDHDPFRSVLDEFAFDKVLSCCVYGFYARRIMYALKLHGKTYVARNAGLLMAEKVRLEGCMATALVPVPLAPGKLRKRGYNQAELLARYISKELGLPVWKDVLIKPRDTASMRMSSAWSRSLSILKARFSTLALWSCHSMARASRLPSIRC